MAKSCSTVNRGVRGVGGFVVGGVAGSLVAAAAAIGWIKWRERGPRGQDAMDIGGLMTVMYGVPLVGLISAGVGTYVGARKPTC